METAWRKAKTLSQLSTMEANVSAAAVSAEACFALPEFFVSGAAILAEAGFALPFLFASAALIFTTQSSSLASLALLEESASDAHSVMEQAKIFRSSPTPNSPWRMAPSVTNLREEDGVAGRPVVLFL